MARIPPEIIEHISPKLRLMLFGMGEERVQQLKDAIDYTYREYGGSQPFSIDDLDEQLSNQISTMTTTGFGVSAALTGRRLQEQFRYDTQPAFRVSSQIMGDYSSAIMSAFSRAEEIAHDWGRTAGTAARNIAAFGTHIAVARAVNMARNAATARQAVQTVQNVNRARRLIRGIRGASTLMGGVGGIVGMGIGFVVGTVVEEVVYRLFVRWMQRRAENLAFTEVAASLFDRNRIVNDFMQYRGVLHGFSGYDGNNAYSIFDNILQQERLGVSMEDYGFDYTRMSNLSRQLITRGMMTDENFEGYMGRAMQLESLFGTDFGDIMTGISILTFGDSEVEEATKLFEEFFVAVSGGGAPQAAHVGLVQELMEFTRSYVQGQKFNLSGYDNLARISAFLTPIFDMHTTAPVQSVVTSVDQALSGALVGGRNYRRVAAEFAANYGISQTEALRGVTAEPDTFEKFIGGLVTEIGIGVESFNEDGVMSDDKLILFHRYAEMGLGMDNESIMNLIPAIRTYVHGGRMEDVRRDILEDEEGRRAEYVSKFDYTNFIREFGLGARAMSTMILENADHMKTLDDLMVRSYIEKIPGIVDALAQMGVTIGGWLTGKRESLPSSGGRDSTSALVDAMDTQTIRSAPPTGTFTYTDPRFEQVSSEAQDYHRRMVSGMGGNLNARISEMGGFLYRSTDPRFEGRRNVGTDVVIGPRGSESPVRFPFSEGVVVFTGTRRTSDGKANYGQSIVFELGPNHMVSFSHMSSISVRVGQRVEYGDIVGTQGKTGQTDGGAHVDIEYRVGGSLSGSIIHGGLIWDPETITRGFSQFLPDFSAPEYGFVDDNEEEGYNEMSGDEDDPTDEEDKLDIDIDAGVYYNDDFVEYIASRVMA